jgi:hypothetical protein
MCIQKREQFARMTEEKKHTSKRWKLSIWVIICLLLLAGSSIFLIANSRDGANHVVATPVTHTKTSTAAHTATRTISSPTPTSTLTPAISQTPQPLFQDYFIDNSRGWLTGNAAGYTRTLDEGALTLAANNHKILVESIPTSTSFDDFSLSMNFTIKQGDANDSVGLYLRGDSNLDHDYRIDIYGNNTYGISKEALDPEDSYQIITPLVNPTHAPQIKAAGHINRLTVIMKGSTLVLFINDVVVQTISDEDYTHGQIALFVQHGTTSEGVQLMVTSLSVYPAPDQLPAGIPTPAASKTAVVKG